MIRFPDFTCLLTGEGEVNFLYFRIPVQWRYTNLVSLFSCQIKYDKGMLSTGIPSNRIVVLLLASVEIKWLPAEYGINAFTRIMLDLNCLQLISTRKTDILHIWLSWILQSSHELCAMQWDCMQDKKCLHEQFEDVSASSSISSATMVSATRDTTSQIVAL